MVDIKKGVFSFGSMTLVVGGVALAGLLFWGWRTGQPLPLWPALLVVAVNLVGAVKLVMEIRARRAMPTPSAGAPARTASDASRQRRR